MPIDRRTFLVRTGLTLSAEVLAAAAACVSASVRELKASPDTKSWRDVRGAFAVDSSMVHMAGMLLATHPRSVREAIDRHRAGLDANPVYYLNETRRDAEARVLAAAARYMGVASEEIALTDSTTMGLGTLYTGIQLRGDQEALTTDHDHYSTRESLRLRSERTGVSVRTIALYDDIETVSADQLVESIRRSVTSRTRLVALTWVHSDTGLKLPIGRIADALATINATRDEADRVLLSVDGVHGFGVEDENISELGCDFFVAGTHKWIFGPRGTGVVWGNSEAWNVAVPTIPTFSWGAGPGSWMTPGGFHSFEHRWALAEAFEFLLGIGRERIADRVHDLNRHLKEGIGKMDHLLLYTPISTELSSGIVCFEHRDLSTYEVVARLGEKGIVASVSPYSSHYARLTPGLLNSHAEVDRVLAALRVIV